MNHYKRLKVKQTATAEEIKTAFRTLAKKWHPDRHQKRKKQAEAKFKEVAEAYRILKDPRLRQEYDLQLEGNSVEMTIQPAAPVRTNFRQGDPGSNMVEDWIDDFFRGPSLDPGE